MRPRHARRLAERREANRNQAGYAPTEWAALSGNERKQLTRAARTRCVVCGSPDGPECTSCTASHDKAMQRAEDL